MPRIPKSAVTVGLPSVSVQPIREVLEIGQAAAGFSEATAELTSRLAEADRADELTEMSSSMEGALADLQLAIQNDPELNTVAAAGQALTAGAEQIYEAAGKSTSKAVNSAFERQFLQSALRAGVAVKRSAFERQSDASIAGLDTSAEDLKRKYALAPDDDERARYREIYARGVDLNSYLTEREKVKRILDFADDTDTGYVRSLIDTGQFAAAEDMLLDPTKLTGMDELSRQAMMRTLNTARDKADTGAQRERAELEDATAKEAYLTQIRFGEGAGPEYTFEDLERDAPNLGFQDLRTIAAGMQTQGVVVVNDNFTVSDLNAEIEANNLDVIAHIHTALRSHLITVDMLGKLLAKNHSWNDDPIAMTPYKQAAKDMRNALGPTSIETSVGNRIDAVDRTNNAIEELEHFRVTHPNAAPTEIRAEGARIRKAYQPQETDGIGARPAPYSLNTRVPTGDQLDAASVQLGDDYDAGLVDDWELSRHQENIKFFKADADARAARNEAKK